MSFIHDQAIRQRALNPHQSFIVQAPAGSGKTELLTQRYLILLSHAKKAPEEIIAITFTKKAAAQMRARILEALQFATENEPDKTDYRHTTWSLASSVLKRDQALHWHLLQNPSRLRILTIDALCAFLCRQTPLLTQFGTAPIICDQPESFYRLASQRFIQDALIQSEWKKHMAHLLLHLDNDAQKCEALFSRLLRSRDQWLPHILYGIRHHQALRKILENSLKNSVLEKMHFAAMTMPSSLKQTILLLACHVGNYFIDNQIQHSLADCAQWQYKNHPALSDMRSWLALSHLFLTKTGELRKNINIQSGFAPKDPNKSLMLSVLTELENYPELIDALKAIQILPPITYTELQWETLMALTTLLPLLSAHLTLIFQEKKQIDFVELNSAALKALGDEDQPTDLSLYLDYQIQHLLIDEFQDTSVTHLHLLEKLVAGWQPDDGRTLFLVGDPMQSIYRFRNAEVGLFLRAQQQGIGAIKLEPLTLTMNFRSQENLIEWFNNTFSLIFPVSSDIATGRVPYSPSIATREKIQDFQAQFYATENENNEAAQLISTMMAIKNKQPRDSIAILVRSRSQLHAIIPELQKQSLDIQAIDIDALTDRPEIRDLLSLTGALHHRADRLAWLSILRAPWCGVSLNDLEIIANHDENKSIWESVLQIESLPVSQDGRKRVNYLRHQLQQAYQKQTQLSVSAWVEGVWLGLNGPACLSKDNELDNVRAFFDLLSTLDAPSFSFEKIIEKCDLLFSNASQINESAIQILTIHKSKGLEFDHVFLPGLHRKIPADDPPLFRWLERVNAFGGDDLILAPIQSIQQSSDLIYDYLKQTEQEKQDYEITRLLYVAATRAKKSLHLFAKIEWDEKNHTPKAPAKGCFLQKLFPVIQDTLGAPVEKNTDKEDSTPAQLQYRLHSDYFDADLTTVKQPAHVNIDIALPDNTPRIIGIVIHEIFQHTALSRLDTHPISEKQIHSRLLSLEILPAEIPACLSVIKEALVNIATDTRAQWILSPQHRDAHCEWALTTVQNNTIQHIIIDRSFIDENNIRWIVDYKTSQPNANETLELFYKKEKTAYRNQLQLYANALHQKENLPVRIGLYFPLIKGWIEYDTSDFPTFAADTIASLKKQTKKEKNR